MYFRSNKAVIFIFYIYIIYIFILNIFILYTRTYVIYVIYIYFYMLYITYVYLSIYLFYLSLYILYILYLYIIYIHIYNKLDDEKSLIQNLKFHVINRQLNKLTKYDITMLQFKTRHSNGMLLRGFDVSITVGKFVLTSVPASVYYFSSFV